MHGSIVCVSNHFLAFHGLFGVAFLMQGSTLRTFSTLVFASQCDSGARYRACHTASKDYKQTVNKTTLTESYDTAHIHTNPRVATVTFNIIVGFQKPALSAKTCFAKTLRISTMTRNNYNGFIHLKEREEQDQLFKLRPEAAVDHQAEMEKTTEVPIPTDCERGCSSTIEESPEQCFQLSSSSHVIINISLASGTLTRGATA
ncbi:hypothetical protein BKA59DRAFT_454487 [Fusarium tricinctum]|uniref:Uncharacterized protein n=1 Tax=Fusarium tricinctum TaxID=61284 RepID=A0A8K0RVC9_9HYPO|nr:hypothetical protein BKA59DRAFT_454487 [Fusarium tricinctum]